MGISEPEHSVRQDDKNIKDHPKPAAEDLFSVEIGRYLLYFEYI